MRIHLYREDGYSLWVLFNRFAELLAALGDTTAPTDPRIVVYYRPSFGRANSQTGIRKQFGEFDLVFGTPQAVYAVESKPYLCGEFNRATKAITLHDRQIRRHAIFRTYRDLWQRHRPQTWRAFRSVALPEFEATYSAWTMAERKNLLGRNLEFVLRSLENCGGSTQDVVLLFHDKTVVFTADDGFRCVSIPLEMVSGSQFVAVVAQPIRSSEP